MDREVAEAIESFDSNGDGQLCFDEFLQLSMNSEHFKFKVAVLNHATRANRPAQVPMEQRLLILKLASPHHRLCTKSLPH